jgi:acyl-coenzyme A thioesterase PaaI-like protein
MPTPEPAIKVLLLPKDTNALGTIFGGVILSHIDLASAVEARKTASHRYVTKAMNGVEFHAPVFVGDLVNFFTETTRIGRTSITVKVVVESRRRGGAMGRRPGRARQSDRSGSRSRRHRARRSARPNPAGHRLAADDRRLRTWIRFERRLRLRHHGFCPR